MRVTKQVPNSQHWGRTPGSRQPRTSYRAAASIQLARHKTTPSKQKLNSPLTVVPVAQSTTLSCCSSSHCSHYITYISHASLWWPCPGLSSSMRNSSRWGAASSADGVLSAGNKLKFRGNRRWLGHCKIQNSFTICSWPSTWARPKWQHTMISKRCTRSDTLTSSYLLHHSSCRIQCQPNKCVTPYHTKGQRAQQCCVLSHTTTGAYTS